MTSFKINSDDQAVRGLQKDNKTPVISGPVLPVKASNPVQKSPENITLNTPVVDRRNSESQLSQRRQIERRKVDNTVLLDTRNHHDRRTKERRRDDVDKDEAGTTLHGIDEVV